MAASASRDLRKALDLRPDLASAWLTLAKLEILDGHFADGAAAARRAFESDAYFEVPNTVSTALFASLRATEFDEARRWCRFGLSHYVGDPRFSKCKLTILGWTGNTAADADAAWRARAKIEQQDTNHILAATWDYRRLMISAVLARATMPETVHERSWRVSRRTPRPSSRCRGAPCRKPTCSFCSRISTAPSRVSLRNCKSHRNRVWRWRPCCGSCRCTRTRVSERWSRHPPAAKTPPHAERARERMVRPPSTIEAHARRKRRATS